MDEPLGTSPAVRTSLWQSDCKDCETERRATAQRRSEKAMARSSGFEYSGNWATRKLDRGQSRSDRCERHRQAHARAIQALAVPYVDLRVIGEVADPANPSGPLGGLGPLPVAHRERIRGTTVDDFDFGMGDADIVALLHGLVDRRVAIVEAGTGSGKSTFMPFRLMNPPPGASLRLLDHGPIVVTEPRVAAAKRVARFVGEQLSYGCGKENCTRHIGPGFPVGYQVQGERHWDAACDLVYVTDGTMINWVRDGQLARIGTVIIDEAHERSENIDIILAQLRDQLARHEHLRLIITSATLDRSFFMGYFGGEDAVFHLGVPAKKSFGYGVPLFIDLEVNDRLIENGLAVRAGGGELRFEGWPAGAGLGDLRAQTRRLAGLRCIEEIPSGEWQQRMPELVAKQAVAIAAGTDEGDILAFLPTSESIDACIALIEQLIAEEDVDIDAFPLLSSTPRETSDRAMAPAGPGRRRKIVVSSNLAETSVTLQGVRYVVDSGLICQAEWDPALASGSFPTKPHSQSGLRQRWGRVGRDSPGWVFPLYTLEQFQQLDRNTPPVSAQVNLETFYMKLVAAGLDLDDALAPGAFVVDEHALDEAGRRHVEGFRTESTRARRTLANIGVFDADGDLSTFGRELERFPGDGGTALAVMLADQLACVHEVALAIAVLPEGRLVGADDECIMRWDRDWPDAWRLRAAQCHRGLALGCSDDLDVLLRIAWLWQSADRPSDWCAQWWINEPALNAAWLDAMDTVWSLSAAMREEAGRPASPNLAARARAVLSRSMVSARYRRVAGGRYVPEAGGEASEQVELRYGRLLDPPDRILAFHRYRRHAQTEEAREPPLISHFVAMLDWAAFEGGDPELLGLDLILRAAEHAEPCPAVRADFLSVIEALPIGLVVAAEPGATPAIRAIAAPFPLPKVARVQTVPSYHGSAPSGFDPNWDLQGAASGSELPDEETATAVLKSADLESNDEPLVTPRAERKRPFTFDPTIYDRASLVAAASNADDREPGASIIVGYRLSPGGFQLLVDRVSETSPSSSPGFHGAAKGWEAVECQLVERCWDHERELAIFERSDGLGRFVVDPRRSPGLDLRDQSFVARMTLGTKVEGRMLPQRFGPASMTLLPFARADLERSPTVTRQWSGRPTPFRMATIVEPANKWNKVVVELDPADPPSGLTYRFELRVDDLTNGGVAASALGTRLLVALKPDRRKWQPDLRLPNERSIGIAKASGGALTVRDGKARAGSRDIQAGLIGNLVANGVPAVEAWSFLDNSLRLAPFGVLSDRPAETLEVPRRLLSLLIPKRVQLEQAWRVELHVSSRNATVTISADDGGPVHSAAELVRTWAQLPRLSALMNPAAGRWLFGDDQANRRRIEALPGIVQLWVDNKIDVITIIGRSVETIESALRQILKPVAGTLTVPLGLSGRIVGKNRGETIRELREATGCSADNEKGSPYWFVRGPSRLNVEDFFRRAAAYAPGSVGTITGIDPLGLVVDDP